MNAVISLILESVVYSLSIDLQKFCFGVMAISWPENDFLTQLVERKRLPFKIKNHLEMKKPGVQTFKEFCLSLKKKNQ